MSSRNLPSYHNSPLYQPQGTAQNLPSGRESQSRYAQPQYRDQPRHSENAVPPSSHDSLHVVEDEDFSRGREYNQEYSSPRQHDFNQQAFSKVIDPNELMLQEGDEIIDPGDGSRPMTFKRRVVTRKEVLIVRKVRVPVITRKVVPCDIQKRVKVKRLVEVGDFEEIEEKYTVFEERKAQRKKKIWVEEIVKEEYTEQVPVTKTRKVKRPVTRIDEVEHTEIVEIPGTKVEEVQGFRIDEIEDRTMLEVEEWEIFELLPHNTGEKIEGKTRDLGQITRSLATRKQGTKVYLTDDLQDAPGQLGALPIDEDSQQTIDMSPIYKKMHVQRSRSRSRSNTGRNGSHSPHNQQSLSASSSPSVHSPTISNVVANLATAFHDKASVSHKGSTTSATRARYSPPRHSIT